MLIKWDLRQKTGRKGGSIKRFQKNIKKKVRKKVKIRKPDYYDTFVCTADQCPMTCCQEWKIGVDDETNKRWKALQPPTGVHPKRKNLSLYTGRKDGDRVIALNREHQCPFLNEQRLCRLVLEYGDSCLSETCRIFPREIHRFADQNEYFLMPSCPAVIDLLQKYGAAPYLEMERQELDHAAQTPCAERKEPANAKQKQDGAEQGEREMLDPVLAAVRKLFAGWMRRTEYTPETNFLHLFYLALDLRKQKQLSLESMQEYDSPALQRELADAIAAVPFDPEAGFEERNELFLDLTVNYREQGMYREELEAAIERAETISEGAEDKQFEAAFAPYRELMRSFLTAELESDCLLPGGTLDDMIMHLEWIALEYAALRQYLYLQWAEAKTLTYEMVRTCIVVICRMTGYEEEDIREYLENSFEQLIWDWGYLRLIL